MNRTLIRGVLAVAVWIGLWKGGGDVAWGLTIYRIGGAELPPPELTQEEGVTFVQINWADVDGKTHGDIDQLDFESGYITPVQLDSTVNLTPLLEERGGQILALDWTGWGRYTEEDIAIFDRDSTTVYLGDGHFASHGPPQKNYIFDFGGRFLIERIRIYRQIWRAEGEERITDLLKQMRDRFGEPEEPVLNCARRASLHLSVLNSLAEEVVLTRKTARIVFPAGTVLTGKVDKSIDLKIESTGRIVLTVPVSGLTAEEGVRKTKEVLSFSKENN